LDFYLVFHLDFLLPVVLEAAEVMAVVVVGNRVGLSVWDLDSGLDFGLGWQSIADHQGLDLDPEVVQIELDRGCFQLVSLSDLVALPGDFEDSMVDCPAQLDSAVVADHRVWQRRVQAVLRVELQNHRWVVERVEAIQYRGRQLVLDPQVGELALGLRDQCLDHQDRREDH